MSVSALLIFCAMISLLFLPAPALAGARTGLELFLQSILPSLLPFWVGCKLLDQLGLVSWASIRVEKLTDRLLGCRGEAAYPLVMGLLSGFPTGARLTAQLVAQKRLSVPEAQRLLPFCTACSPMFAIGTVGAAFWGDAKAGALLLLCHYVALLSVAMVFRGHGRAQSHAPQPTAARTVGFGSALGSAMGEAMPILWQVGGFIILFSAMIQVLLALGLSSWLPEWGAALLGGLLEMSNGCRAATAGGLTPLSAGLVCAILSFSGLCIHAQSAAFLRAAGVPMGRYFAAKACQGAVGFAVAYGAFSYLMPCLPAASGALPRWDINLAAAWVALGIGALLCALAARPKCQKQR